MENEKHPLDYLKNEEITEKIEKHSVGPGIWQETVKNVKYKKYTLRNLDFGEKIEKRGK